MEDGKGRPIAGAEITVKPAPASATGPYATWFNDRDQTVVAVSDAQGRFELRHRRGEYLVIEPGGETGGDGIVATIQFIEHLGQDNYIHVGVGGSLIIGRFSSDQNFEIGQTVRLLPKQSKVHFFDPQTEKAIG